MLFVIRKINYHPNFKQVLEVAQHKKNINRWVGLYFGQDDDYTPVYVGY